MKPVPAEPPDLVPRLRQQLILAQVRIMELEDERDGLRPRLAELEQLLSAAQTLADRKLDEATHLEMVLGGRTTQCDHLQEALKQAAHEITTVRTILSDSAAGLAQQQESLAGLEAALRRAEADLSAVKSSRSWRWTAWLRALGGKPGDRPA